LSRFVRSLSPQGKQPKGKKREIRRISQRCHDCPKKLPVHREKQKTKKRRQGRQRTGQKTSCLEFIGVAKRENKRKKIEFTGAV